MCKKCAEGCLTCSGPTNNECKLCNFLNGYSFKNIDMSNGECIKTECADGYYLLIDAIMNKTYCNQCDKACKKCNGKGPDHCQECNARYKFYQSKAGNNSVCMTCEEASQGYYTASDGTCKGIF